MIALVVVFLYVLLPIISISGCLGAIDSKELAVAILIIWLVITFLILRVAPRNR